MWKNPIPFVGLCLIATVAGAEPIYHELELAGGGTLRFALVLPRDFDPQRSYPALLALPPGGQDERMVEAGLERYWGRQAAERGWLVASPVAPEGVMFFRGSERYLQELLAHLRASYKIEGGRFHLAGNSNGGLSAFRIALDHPDDFLSLLALPGFPPDDRDFERLERLAGKPVRLFVGGRDKGWIEPMQRTRDVLAGLGADVTLTVLPGEGHVPPSLDGGRFMDELTAVRALAATNEAGGGEGNAVSAVLDALHDAASKADGERYFALFDPAAVFFGTAPEERWTVDEFRAFADPYFDAGRGWTYRKVSRHVFLAAGGDTAWFDEELANDNYGRCRGTGVLVKVADGWRIVQYNLTIPIPNELAPELVEKIREAPRN